MPTETAWFPYVYVYSIGGLLFIAGMVIALRSGAMNLSTRRGRIILVLLLGGMLFFLAFHFFFQFVAPDLVRAGPETPAALLSHASPRKPIASPRKPRAEARHSAAGAPEGRCHLSGEAL